MDAVIGNTDRFVSQDHGHGSMEYHHIYEKRKTLEPYGNVKLFPNDRELPTRSPRDREKSQGL